MADAEEIDRSNDCIVITIDIEDCPIAELPLADLFDVDTMTLRDNYHDLVRESVAQQLEDTTWLPADSMSLLTDAGFGMYHARDRHTIISLRKPAFQRLIVKRLGDRPRPSSAVYVPILIRFLLADNAIPTPRRSSTTASSARSERGSRRSRVPSEVDTIASSIAPAIDVPLRATARPADGIPTHDPVVTDDNNPAGDTQPRPVPETATQAPKATFRGRNVDASAVGGNGGPPFSRFQTPTDQYAGVTPPLRPVFESATTTRTNALVRTPTRNHPFSSEVTFGAETFEEYMTQFMYAEVKFKDFRKAVIPKFDAGKRDSFVHWYKLFCSTCLQWGIWCPPYESAKEDEVHGAWWCLLPESVREADRFMAGLIYSALILESTFPVGSKEQNAVEGCPPNAGYHALYALFRLHHPLLHSVLSTANEIPRQYRNEPFSLYIRRLQDFMVRERLATRTYTESEALDLAVRNLLPDWRADYRRLVERDKRTGPSGTLPFKLSMPQLATTFVEYAAETGRDVPTSSHSAHRSSAPSTGGVIRRIETAPFSHDSGESVDDGLADDEIELLVRSMTQNQSASATCLGCQQPGHTLADCNRFVDYIVAESLAQRHPQLKAQVAASHRQFRSRLALAGARSRSGPSSNASAPVSRTVRSIHADQPTVGTTISSLESPAIPPDGPFDDDCGPTRYQQHSITTNADDDNSDFEECFTAATMRSVTIDVATAPFALPTSDTVVTSEILAPAEPLLLRRLAATHDPDSDLSFAHADNGSMACTTNEASLLFAYRPLRQTNVRLFDAGQHAHHPTGVGFLCVPVDNRGRPGTPAHVFIRTYHTPTIPGIIISHSAISKQLGTTGYHMSSFADSPGFVHFPHRLRRSQDVYIRLQPMNLRGGLTFTEALIVPSADAHLKPLPRELSVRRLCTDHDPVPTNPVSLLDPTDGMHCKPCHVPPESDFL
jgi:hypothetical protein